MPSTPIAEPLNEYVIDFSGIMNNEMMSLSKSVKDKAMMSVRFALQKQLSGLLADGRVGLITEDISVSPLMGIRLQSTRSVAQAIANVFARNIDPRILVKDSKGNVVAPVVLEAPNKAGPLPADRRTHTALAL